MNEYLAQLCGTCFKTLSISQSLFRISSSVSKEHLEALLKLVQEQEGFLKAGILAYDDLKKASS